MPYNKLPIITINCDNFVKLNTISKHWWYQRYQRKMKGKCKIRTQ